MPQPPPELFLARNLPTDRYGFIERRACPVCSSPSPVSLYRSGFGEGVIGRFVTSYYGVNPTELDAAPFELMRCSECALVYQRFVGDDRLLHDLYGKWIHHSNLPERDSEYQAEVSAPLRSRDGHEILVAAGFLGRSPNQMTVLDFGMGWGLWARIAQQLGCASYGQEIVEARLAFAESQGVYPIGTGDLGRPMFDFINTEQVMEHIRDVATTATLLASSLRPGGVIKVSVPNAAGATRISAALRANRCRGTIDELMPVHPLEHVNSFNSRALYMLAVRLGLEIVEPSMLQRYAFLRRRGSLAVSHPRKTLKELVRPVYAKYNRRNLSVWMRKPP